MTNIALVRTLIATDAKLHKIAGADGVQAILVLDDARLERLVAMVEKAAKPDPEGDALVRDILA